MSCTFTAERAFGPAVSSCRRVFDFTLFFEEVFFALLPSSLLLIGSAVRLSVLVKRPVLGTRGLLYFLKLVRTEPLTKSLTLVGHLMTSKQVAAIIFAALELLSLIFIGTDHGETTHVSIPAAVLSLLASVAIAIVSHYEHTRSHRPSFLLAFYLCLTVLFRSVMARTYWSLDTYRTVASIAIAALVVQIVMAVLENGGKDQAFKEAQPKKRSSEETAGFISRSLFLWLNRLLWTGYRRTLAASDLQPIDQNLNSTRLSARFASVSAPNTGTCT